MDTLEMICKHSEEFANPVNVLEYMLNMAQHQSSYLNYSGIDNVYSIDHSRDKLSDNDATGTVAQFTTRRSRVGFSAHIQLPPLERISKHLLHQKHLKMFRKR